MRAFLVIPMLITILAIIPACSFEPDIVPLVIVGPDSEIIQPTIQANQDFPDVSPPIQPETIFSYPVSRGGKNVYAILAGVFSATFATMALFLFRKQKPRSVGGLVVLGVLLTLLILLVELIFVQAEAILVGPNLTGNPIAILLSLLIVALGIFLINLDIAYWSYVYRVYRSLDPLSEEFNLNPFDGWGLGDP